MMVGGVARDELVQGLRRRWFSAVVLKVDAWRSGSWSHQFRTSNCTYKGKVTLKTEGFYNKKDHNDEGAKY